MTSDATPPSNEDVRNVCVCVTGGIAAYKVAYLVSELAQAQYNVTVAMTPAALKFIGSATFVALSGNPVITSVFDDAGAPYGAHVKIADACELLLVAPATADFIAKAAAGISDCVASTTYLTFRGPVIIAPAMNSSMWDKPSTQRNIAQLKDDGAIIVDPDSGWLSCRQVGMGRLVDTARLLSEIHENYPK